MIGRTRPPFPAATVLVVAVGAGLGAVVRHLIELTLADEAAALMVINLTGSLALGLLVGLIMAEHRDPRHGVRQAYVLLGPGFLGGYTTFSTVMVTTIADGSPAALLLAVQLIGGVLLAAIGIRLGALLPELGLRRP